MRLTNLIQNQTNKIHRTLNLSLSFLLLLLTVACSESSEESDESGYLKIYNASSNAPTVYLEIEGESLTQASFSNSSVLYPMISEDYDITLSWREGSDDYTEFYEQEVNIKGEEVELVVLAGDFNNPEIITYNYLDEDEQLYDEDDEDDFTLRFINLFDQELNVDIYISRDDQTFNEATPLGNYSYKEMSDSHYFEVESYIFYITNQGSSEVIYESNIIDFFYNTQYIMAVRDNSGPSNSPVTLDKISKNSAVIEYPDKDSRAELRVYNGLTKHLLLADFENNIDVRINGLAEQASISELAKGSFSEVLDLSSGDYALDFSDSESEQYFANNYLVSLGSNQDKTVFVYLTEEREDDDNDSDTEDQISIFVNTLPVNNSQRVSLYDHQVNVINFIQDDEQRFSVLDVNFVRSNETVSSAEYDVSVSHGNPKTILLPNNTYDINIIAQVDESELLIIYEQLTLDADSGDLFMILEQDQSTSSGYSIKFEQQDSN